MRQLLRIAASQETRVHVSHLPENVLGYWSPDERRIYYDMRLTPNKARVTIAHELGHAHYGHRGDSARNEREADKFAASLLIDPELSPRSSQSTLIPISLQTSSASQRIVSCTTSSTASLGSTALPMPTRATDPANGRTGA